MGCVSSHQRFLRTPGSRFVAPIPENLELQLEVLDPFKTITTPVGILSLPAELICHILLLLHFKDLSCCVLACKTFWHAAQNFADIQFLFELYAQGLTETPSLDWVDVSSKMYSLKTLASMWRSDFHLNTIFEETATVDIAGDILRMQSVKCGLWWMYSEVTGRLFIRGYDTNTKLSQTLPGPSLVSQENFIMLTSVVVDPLQDLVVIVLGSTNTQDHDVFSVAFQLASSRSPHPDSACNSLKCKHPCDTVPDINIVLLAGRPAICGDRIIVLYYTRNLNLLGTVATSNIFIQVIDWRKGRVKGYPLCELGGKGANFHLLDEQRIVVIGPEGRMALYTLPELDGSPQRRTVYILPRVQQGLDFYLYPGQLTLNPVYAIHASPSFHGAAARSNLTPDYITSLESQIIVLEVLSSAWQVILVIDMVIFSEKAIRFETSVEIPWSEWGPKYARCFPHHPSHRISVFGSKMAYALPQDRTPEPGQRLERLYAEGSFYVHIWDFNRAIARSERSDNVYDYNSLARPIRRPGRLAQTCFNKDDENIITNLPYTTAVCPTGFSTRYFDQFFLEQDRLSLLWVRHDSVQIQVVSPSPKVTSGIDPDVG
ncbi:hypothetical protein BDR04DRAFT_1098308 [Suillus decipiens]|nr:hypothetical protein BDR04DRAFT_1098308 [Suillus decipiens]